MSVKHSFVIPCYNEAGNIRKFFSAAKAAMVGYTDDYEFIFVNDGSTDKSDEIFKDLFNENRDTKIKVINFSRNFGKEAAMYAGLKESKGEYTTIIDGDLQQRPEVAVEMGRFLDENDSYDMVAAFQEKRSDGKALGKIKTYFYSFINKISDADFIEDASDFRTMRRKVVNTILEMTEYHRFSKGIFSWIGYKTFSMPYQVMKREAGETKWSIGKLIKYALDGIISFSDFPLKLPVYFGIATAALDLMLLAVLAVLSIGFDVDCGLGFIAWLIIFMFSVLFVFVGIIGSYLGKVHTQTKNRPIYIAKEILTYEETD